MSILQYASPQARYYQADRDILNDYDNRINLYNKALEQYRTDAGAYQTKVDAFNETVNKYNADLNAWKQKAEAYNKKIADWNATDRTTPYNQWSGTVASPGKWFGTAPVFKGGDAPVAPNNPGFGQTDVDTFLKQAESRAIRRGNTAATAQQVMTSPGQYYVAGRENFGSTPEVSLAGMSGFGSSAMGFQEGGMVPGLAFHNSIKPQTTGASLSQALGEEAQAPVPASEGPPALGQMQGIGGLFQQMNQNFHNQMGMMQSQPLNVYRNYLAQTYVGPQVQKETQKVDHFVDLVDQAERAHFGVEESFGFGGGPMSQQFQTQFQQGLPQPYQQQQQLQQQQLQAQLFSQGGAVDAITEEALAEMRQKVMNDYGFDPVDVAMEESVDPELYLRVMYTENKGRQGPRSESGAIGLMQLMPATAREMGVDPNNPLDNARGGARYLRRMMNEFGTVPLALAAYNAGPGNVRKYGGLPPFEETRNYVAQIHGVDRGEILPSPARSSAEATTTAATGMGQFFQRTPGADPSPRPRRRPDDLGTVSYTPPDIDFRANSEYLMAGIGNIFAQPMEEEAVTRPYIPNIMQQQPKGPKAQRGIDFYRQYAPFAK